jgi:hypothetical protein
MNQSQYKPFKRYLFYDYSIYSQTFENVTRHKMRPFYTDCTNLASK